MPSLEYYEGEMFEEDLFADIREKRLANLLSNEVYESEQKWLTYNFEEAQVKIDITDMILEDMIEEICILVNGKEENLNKGEDGHSIFQILPIELIEIEQQRQTVLDRIIENNIEAIFK